jgi:hypothetical protein
MVDRLKEPRAAARQGKADNFERQMESVRGAPPIALNLEGHNTFDGSGYTNEFPARLIPKHPRDTQILDKEDAYRLEQEKLRMNGNQNQTIVRTVDQRDIDYVRDKRAVMNKLQQEDWMNKVIDKSNPAEGKTRKTPKPKKTIAKKKAANKKTNIAYSRSVHRNRKKNLR